MTAEKSPGGSPPGLFPFALCAVAPLRTREGRGTFGIRGARVSSFEFVFSLFGLLLGLALAEVLAGLANALKLRRRGRHLDIQVTRLGLATPLLAAFLAIDIGGFWFLAWRARDFIPPLPASLLVGLVITGLYYFAATWVFPDEADSGADLNAHFDLNKRAVLGMVLLCNVLAHGFRLLVAGPARLGFNSPITLATLAIYFALLTFAALAPRRWQSSVALSLLIALYVWDAAVSTTVTPIGA